MSKSQLMQQAQMAAAASQVNHQTSGYHSPKQSKHWSQKVHESLLSCESIQSSGLIEHICGGSDSGQFIHFDSELPPVDVLAGKILADEIILEIEGQKLSGYTLYDVKSWIRQLASTYPQLTLRSVKAALLAPNLRAYLDERFQKGSVDYDLQQSIRENVYMRTVPCTTRAARNGEINGQDYIFLTDDEFLELERNGDLLEYGVYNGHYYGTPKPPKEPKMMLGNATHQLSLIASSLTGAHVSPALLTQVNGGTKLPTSSSSSLGAAIIGNAVMSNGFSAGRNGK